MRKEWMVGVRLAAVVSVGALALAASGCEKGGGAAASKCTTQGTVIEISGNHGHAIDIPAEAVKRGMGGTYAVKGGDHEHAIVLKDADQKSLAAGTPVKTRTGSTNAHVHEVEIKCKD